MSKTKSFEEEMEEIMQIVRASQGLTPQPKDAISNLVNVKNYLERSRYPTYTIMKGITYYEMAYKIFGEPAKVLHQTAKTKSEALIEYKGQGRQEWVDAVRSANIPEQTSFFFGDQRKQQQEPKRRFWQRKQKEQTEFRDQ